MDAPLPENLTEEWQKFLADDDKRPSGQDSYGDLFNHNLLFPLQRRKELEGMVKIARSLHPRAALIVGGDKGGDAYSFLKAIPSIEMLVTIEIRGTPYIGDFREAFPDVQIHGIAASSYDPQAVEKVSKLIGDSYGHFDFVFLDGDKGAFLKDYSIYYPMIRRGGVCFVHDINPCGPNDPTVAAWKTIKKTSSRSEEIIDFTEVQPELEKERLGQNPSCSHADWVRIWRDKSCGVGVVYK